MDIERRNRLLTLVRSYNPQMREKDLDALIARQGFEAVEFAAKGAAGKSSAAKGTKALQQPSPLDTLYGHKQMTVEEMTTQQAIDAMCEALKVPSALAEQLSRKFSEQQIYDVYKAALESTGKHVSFIAEVKARHHPRPGLLDGLFRKDLR